MRRIIAIAYTLIAIGSFLIGYFSNSGPLDYVYFVIAGIPWTQIFSWVLPASIGGSPAIAFVGVSLTWLLYGGGRPARQNRVIILSSNVVVRSASAFPQVISR
jgi:ABC-type Na+ efflux pump permease subunit